MVNIAVWFSLLTFFLFSISPFLARVSVVGRFAPGLALLVYLLATAVGLFIFRRHLYIWCYKTLKSWRLFPVLLAVTVMTCLVLTLVLTHFIWTQPYSATTITLEKESAHDVFWHLALMQSLDNSVPPENPIYAGQPLRGYHYFNDLLWVAVHQLTVIPVTTLYLTVAPLVLAAFFVATAVGLIKRVTSSPWAVWAGTILLSIGSGLAYVAPVLFPEAVVKQSLFWLDQPTHYGFNQQLLFSLALVQVFIAELVPQTKKEVRWWVLAVILVALAGIKVYAVLLLIPAVLLAYGWSWARFKNRQMMYGWLVGSVLAAGVLLSARGETGWPFIFFPGYFFKTMFEANDRLAASVWELQRQIFAADNNYLRLSIHWAYAALVFYLGNFGVKVVGLVLSCWLVIRGQLKSEPFWLFLLALITGSWLAPALFIQKGVVWNTIQFMHFAQAPLVLLLIMSWEKWPARVLLKQVFLVVLVLLSLPTTIISIYQFAHRERFSLGSSTISTLQQLRSAEYVNKPLVVSNELIELAFVSAYAERAVYFADPAIAEILGLGSSERYEQVRTNSYCPDGAVFVYSDSEKKVRFTSCEELVSTASASGLLE